MGHNSVDLNNFVQTVVRNRDDILIIEQLRDLINDKYITTRPISTPPIQFNSGRYPLPFMEHIKDAVRREFRRVYDTDQISIITQNLLELYYLLWNQNITGFQIYTIITLVLQDEPIEIIQRLIPENLIKIYDNLSYDGNMILDSRRMLILHEEYVELTMHLLHSERILNNHLMLKLEDISGTLNEGWYDETYTSQCIAYHRPLEWELLARGWPLDRIEEYIGDYVHF